MTNVVNKSDLIEYIASQCETLSDAKAEMAVRQIIDLMSYSLTQDNRIEVRGFGTFCLTHREARWGRNPKTGEQVFVPAKAVPHFKPGKALKEGVSDKLLSNLKV